MARTSRFTRFTKSTRISGGQFSSSLQPGIAFSITGTEALEEALAALPAKVHKQSLTKILKKNAQPIADAAASRARRRSGTLARSYKVGTKLSPRQASLEKADPSEYTTQVYVGAGPLVQAITEEFGTVHSSAHPTLRPAWEAGRSALWTGIIKDLWSLISGGRGITSSGESE